MTGKYRQNPEKLSKAGMPALLNYPLTLKMMEKVQSKHSLAIFYVFLIFCAYISGCQGTSVLQADREEIVLGKVTDNARIPFFFYLVNQGRMDVIVKDVRSSVSNVILKDYPDMVKAGDTAKVEMILVANGMDGAFAIKLDVVTEAKKQPRSLLLKGFVEKTPETIEQRCKAVFGLLRVEKRDIDFGRVKMHKEYRDTLLVYNPTDKIVKVDVVNHSDLVKAELLDDEIYPGKASWLEVRFRADDSLCLGKCYENVVCMIGEKERTTGLLAVGADVVENFELLSEDELKNAPVLYVEQPKFDFGKIRQGTEVTHAFVLKNQGKRNLIIRKVQAACGCTAVVDGQRVIAPGASVPLDVVYKSAGREGAQQKSILLFTNDPEHSEVKLWISGTVTK